MKDFYLEPLPNCDVSNLSGKLIVLEGADGSGRSTQIKQLKVWFERKGYAVAEFGIRRSPLVGPELDKAREGNILGPTTMGLFYATDFIDQLESILIPALRAGFIVLADRYIYTLMARDIVRGADLKWVQNVYGLAVVPDIVFYLKVSPKKLIERRWTKSETMDYWESGMDLGLSRDWITSFFIYQKRLSAIFLKLQNIYDFTVVDGNRSKKVLEEELVSRIKTIL